MTQTTTNIMNSVCRKSCTNALTNCLVLTEPRARQQRTNDTGKENQKTVETTQNLMNPISLNGFSSSFFAVWFSVFIRSLYCIYQLGNCCQHRGVYHDAVIDCRVFLCFLCSVISCIFRSWVWGGVSVISSEPMDGKI